MAIKLWVIVSLEAKRTVQYFEEALPEGWVYPCSLEDVKRRIDAFSASETEGIEAIGLCRSTNRDQYANARYFPGRSATIRLYSWKADLRLLLPAHTKSSVALRYFDVEQAYGMQIEVVGNRLICGWKVDDLKRFILEHVIVHEIGHHVYRRGRIDRGLHYESGTAESEKFAEAFARRLRRNAK